MKKNIANMAKLTAKATMFAPRNVRERKNAKSTIGAGERRSISGERGEGDDRRGEQRDDARRAPAPLVALDEREDERGQAHGERRDARGSRSAG
jgi:hypothetical protein